jgi:CheY-like chemotaxis protein
MIADDDKMNIMILSRMLEMMPTITQYQVQILTANNGQEALDMYKTTKNIKLILMDCEMPILDGYDASKKIREYEASLRAKSNKVISAIIVGISGN